MEILHSHVVVVTPEIASRWLADWHYPRQRRLRPDRVKFLADEMIKGTFQPGTSIQVVCENGKYYLIDGQHRLHGVIQSRKTVEFVLTITQADSAAKTAERYSNTDVGLGRTVADMFSAFNLSEELGLSVTHINKLGPAVLFVLSGFVRTRSGMVSRDVHLANIRLYAPAAGEYFEVVAGTPSEIGDAINRAATLGVALVTFKYSKSVFGSKVDDFWSGVAFDDGLKIGDPRKTANKHLLTTGMSIGGGNNKKPNVATPAYSSRYLANCFNAFIDGRSIQSTKVHEPTAPIKIAGSPFRG